MSGLLYLDASALVKLVLAEHGSDDVLRRVDAASEIATSAVALVEIRRALRRVDPGRDPAEVTDRCITVNLDQAIIDAAGDLAPASLRALDAIHVATAMAIGPELDAFVTFDRRQAAAAAAVERAVDLPSRPRGRADTRCIR